jgi:hypothetical protein
MNTYKKVTALLEGIQNSLKIHPASKSRVQEIQLYSEYSEPGYDDPESGVIALGDWNNASIQRRKKHCSRTMEWVDADNTMERLAKVLEHWGVELEWHDEWTSCQECGGLVRTSPGGYSWQPDYMIFNDCELICHECIDPVDALTHLEGNERSCLTIEKIKPEDHGYIKLNDDSYESGFHPGQNDSPEKIAKELRKKGCSRFLFSLDSNSQFTTQFSVWIHEDEKHLVNQVPVAQ